MIAAVAQIVRESWGAVNASLLDYADSILIAQCALHADESIPLIAPCTRFRFLQVPALVSLTHSSSVCACPSPLEQKMLSHVHKITAQDAVTE